MQADQRIFAFLFTDIKESTALWAKHPDHMPALLARHNFLLGDAISQAKGSIFKTVGDSFCVAFNSVGAAANAALTGQRALLSEPWGEHEISVRMAVHVGPATELDGDYYGAALSQISRLLSFAYGSQILFSEAAKAIGFDQLPAGCNFRDVGAIRLRGFERSENCYQLVHPDLPSDFPPPRHPNESMTNLSYEVTSFVGREEELAMLWREWQNARLITLTGPAGAGKTRLALRFASELVLDHPEGVWRVDLADITKDQRVASAVSATLGTRTSGNDMVQAVVNQLRKSSVFLVFDNCDQARTGCRDVAATILQNCPRVHILATSREALGAAEETIVQLSPLSIPDRHSGLSEPAQQKSTAVKLFVDRAKAVTSGFHLSERNVSNVADICRKLDGIPLAIELVAARSQGLSARDLLRRIDRRLGNASVQPHGHSSNEEKINSTIEWSYEALSPLGQEVLQRLTVFVGGWTLEDAEAICSDDEVQAVQIREQLRDLVEKSLVSVSVNDDDSSRFTCLDIIREYVIAQRAGKDFTALKRRHASYYALKARELSKIPPGVAISESLASLYRERGNVGAALEYLLTTGAQEEATAIRESFRQFLGDTPPVPGKP